MGLFRIALANMRYPESPEASVSLAQQAIAEAGRQGAGIICFPECYTPGYRGLGKEPPPPYGLEGVLIADLDLDQATGLLASRYRPI